jgi:hypothetical protein
VDDPRVTLPNMETIEDILLDIGDIMNDDILYKAIVLESGIIKEIVIYDMDKSKMVPLEPFYGETDEMPTMESFIIGKYYSVYKNLSFLSVKYPLNLNFDDKMIIIESLDRKKISLIIDTTRLMYLNIKYIIILIS